ncbi:hypothetical protein [Paraburkholderia nodosa]|uniref:hypothetical protein n=1 Tax=Paraburkholderia nodosa TaxID=392320 RepID=UPI000A8FC984|nr:hypothetical protein [Paraburkholderia nodosa]
MGQANRSFFARAWPAVVARLIGLSSGRRRHSVIRSASEDVAQAEPVSTHSSRTCPEANATYPDLDGHASWLDERSFCLYVPIVAGSGERGLAVWADRLRTLGLASVVTTVGESLRDSVDVLHAGCDAGLAEPEPYLEVLVGGETGAFLYYRGDEIEDELSALHDALDRRSHASRPPS